MPLIDPITMSPTPTPKKVSFEASTKPPAPVPTPKTSQPTELLTTDLAPIYTHAHPALLLSSTYFFRFSALVADPVKTLLGGLLHVAILQVTYALICLPAYGSSPRGLKKVKFSTGKKTLETARGSRLFTTIYALALTTLSTIPLLILTILFGAPITSHLPHTALFSAHLALLALFPLFYVHGASPQKWREIASFYAPFDEVFGGFVGALIGAWLGAVPIPLDWDREWQRWPVTVVVGAYGGYAVGKVLGGGWARGRRIEFD